MKTKDLEAMFRAFWYLLFLFALNFLWFGYNGNVCAVLLGNQTDYLALLSFKQSVSNDPHQILGSWNSSTHHCNWFGVTCNPQHQRVTELSLKGYGLHGVLSPHIGNLSFLRILELRNNSFHGDIPQQLGRLFRLRQLSLPNNSLVGEIPINLTRCFQLRFLNLHGNLLRGKIPTEIGALSQLERLVLNKNNLTGQIPASMGNLSSLVVLSMARNNLDGNIPKEISHLKLEGLALPSNKLSGTLPSSLYNMSSLTFISLGINQFSGSLPANMFFTLPNLQLFVINANKMSGPIPTSISNASMLQQVSIGDNYFVGQVPSLGNLQDLRLLGLYLNNLGNNSTQDLKFLNSLINCSELGILDIGSNNFGGPLPNSVGNLSTQLYELNLDGLQIQGKIPEALGNLINLFLLNLQDNHLTQIIPSTFGMFQRMQALRLNGNRLSGEIPSFIGNLSQLFYLDLSLNNFEGNIPQGNVYSQSLQYVDFSKNNLTGAIPVDVVCLSTLLQLNLSENSLNGTLPVEVGKLRNINMLDVSENHLFGDIPETLGDCRSLEYLYLQGNSFHENIPSSLTSLKGLKRLDLSRNKLFGSLPKGLQNLSVLEYFNVSFNMLEGEVPKEGVFGNASALSVIGNSKLCGGIKELQLPPCPIKVMKHRKHHSFKLIGVITCVIAFLILLSSIFIIYQMRKRNKKSSLNSLAIGQLSKVSYQSLHNATDGFLVSNLIGSGSFGSVYRGSLESKVVAIKVLKLEKKGAHKSFIAECNALRNVRHRNLVKILTCCSSTNYKGHEFKALVFEYMVNGSLEKWLYSSMESVNHARNFLLDQRLNVIIDVASALHYLHCECEQPMVHCDLKPSNILLDGDMVAHVGDFGLARLLSTSKGISHEQSSTIGIKGTIGYAPPEYGMGSVVSTQGDIYSFGILIMEMFTRRKPTDEALINGMNLHNYVKHAFPDNLLQIVDPNLFPRSDAELGTNEEENGEIILTPVHPNMEKCLISIFKIGLACSIESPNQRMSITDVNRELNLLRNAFLAAGINRG